MHDCNIPDAAAQIVYFCLATKIHVIKMEIKLFVKKELVLGYYLRINGKHYAVKKFDGLPGGSVERNLLRRVYFAVRHYAFQVFRRIPVELFINEGPCRLSIDAPVIPGHSNDVKACQTFLYPLWNKIVQDMNIVMYENEVDRIADCIPDSRVVNDR